MLSTVVMALLVSTAAGALLRGQDRFHEYMANYGRDYEINSEEYMLRRALFAERDGRILAHNGHADRLWNAGHNHLTDRTEEELRPLYGWRPVGGAARQGMALLSAESLSESARNASLPKQVDWSSLKSLKLSFDQRECGSCWAVATAAMLTARYELHTQDKVVKHFSPQQLVDCVPNPKSCGGTGGCKGATVELGLSYAMTKGLDNLKSLVDYHYTAADQTCEPSMKVESGQASLTTAASCSQHGAMFRTWETLPKNKAGPLLQNLLDGPIGVSVGANTWQSYSDGVFNGCDKDVVIDHAVLLVGYGQDKIRGRDVKWWKIRNSWGALWGEAGYIRMLRQDTVDEEDALCGVDNDPAAGVACAPYPEKDTVCGMCGLLYDSAVAKLERCESAPGETA